MPRRPVIRTAFAARPAATRAAHFPCVVVVRRDVCHETHSAKDGARAVDTNLP